MQPAYLPQEARQNVDYELAFGIREAVSATAWPITDWVFWMQVRIDPGDPGDPLIEVTNSSSTAGDGIVVDLEAAFVTVTITWDTLSAPEIPAGRLAYDVIAELPDGSRWGLLYGEFIAKPGVTNV